MDNVQEQFNAVAKDYDKQRRKFEILFFYFSFLFLIKLYINMNSIFNQQIHHLLIEQKMELKEVLEK